MNSRNTWLWAALAAGLFGLIFLYEHQARQNNQGPRKVLPGFQAAAVTSVQVQPAGQLEIRAVRTNGGWVLSQPLVYPAEAAGIENLLAALEKLTPAPYLAPQELNNEPEADRKFGFDSWQASLALQQSNDNFHFYIGNRTAPGDQVFVQVVGDAGIHVVNADFLKLLPQTADDWRDKVLVDFRQLPFDRIMVTNAGNVLEMEREPAGNLWRMIFPIKTSADKDKVEQSLRQLARLRVNQFISDDPRADLETLGLQPADLSVSLALGSNTVLWLEFGKSPTNNPNLEYARRRDLGPVVTVSSDLLKPWRESHEFFRDRHLVRMTELPDEIKIRAQDEFALQRQTNNLWRILPDGFPADSIAVQQLLIELGGLQVTEFVKDSVTDLGLTNYGLGVPARQVILENVVTNSAGVVSNVPLAELDFGTNGGKVFARRANEDFVYAIAPDDFQRLDLASWQLRDHRIWNFSENDVMGMMIRKDGQARQFIRNGTNNWSLAPGSQGVIDTLATEQVAHELGQLTAASWAGRGGKDLAQFGLAAQSPQISIELKDGEKLNLEVGGAAPSGSPYAAVVLEDHQPWIFEFPLPLYQALSDDFRHL